MMHDHKPDEVSDGAPQQIDATVAHGDIILAIDGTGCGGKGSIVLGEILEADLVAVESRPTFAAARRGRRRRVGNRIAFGARHQMMPLGQERANYLATRIIRIRDEHHLAIPDPCYRKQQRHQFVQQGSGVPVGKHQAFMNARSQRHGGHLSSRSMDQQRDRLK